MHLLRNSALTISITASLLPQQITPLDSWRENSEILPKTRITKFTVGFHQRVCSPRPRRAWGRPRALSPTQKRPLHRMR